MHTRQKNRTYVQNSIRFAWLVSLSNHGQGVVISCQLLVVRVHRRNGCIRQGFLKLGISDSIIEVSLKQVSG